MAISNNLKSILKHSFTICLLLVLSALAPMGASAKTITESNNVVDNSALLYFDNIYDRGDYRYYLLASEYEENASSYTYTTYYYLCLSNDAPEIKDVSNASSSCDVLYKFYRQNSKYSIETVDDDTLTVENSLYYYYTKFDIVGNLLFLMSILILTYILYRILMDIFWV